MKFSIKDFFSKCDQIRRMENFIFCAVIGMYALEWIAMNVILLLLLLLFRIHLLLVLLLLLLLLLLPFFIVII